MQQASQAPRILQEARDGGKRRGVPPRTPDQEALPPCIFPAVRCRGDRAVVSDADGTPLPPGAIEPAVQRGAPPRRHPRTRTVAWAAGRARISKDGIPWMRHALNPASSASMSARRISTSSFTSLVTPLVIPLVIPLGGPRARGSA